MHLTVVRAKPVYPLREALLLNLETQPDDIAEVEGRAFAELVERHSTFLYRIAWSLLRNSQEAEDAVHDCLLKLFRTGRWKAMSDEKAFLARSCWRAALDRLPRQKVIYVEASDKSLAPVTANPESEAIASAEQNRLHRLIDALPLVLREPLLLSSFEELNSREIAGIMKLPEGTVRTRLKRARDELRHRWLEQDEHSARLRKEHAL